MTHDSPAEAAARRGQRRRRARAEETARVKSPAVRVLRLARTHGGRTGQHASARAQSAGEQCGRSAPECGRVTCTHGAARARQMQTRGQEGRLEVKHGPWARQRLPQDEDAALSRRTSNGRFSIALSSRSSPPRRSANRPSRLRAHCATMLHYCCRFCCLLLYFLRIAEKKREPYC